MNGCNGLVQNGQQMDGSRGREAKDGVNEKGIILMVLPLTKKENKATPTVMKKFGMRVQTPAAM